MGRRSGPKLLLADRDTRRRFLTAIRAGTPLKYAANHAGINASTVWRALRRAEDAEDKLGAGESLTSDDLLCRIFAHEVKVARAAVAVRNMEVIQEAAQGGQLLKRRTWPNGVVEEDFAPIDWRAASRLLGISFGHELAQARQLEVVEDGPCPARDEASSKLERLAAALRAEIERDAGDAPLEDDVGHGGAVTAGDRRGYIELSPAAFARIAQAIAG